MISALVGGWMVVVSMWDLRSQRIPNLLILPAAVIAVLAIAVTQEALLGAPWTSALLGLAVAAAPWLAGYGFGRVGAGDVKFAAVLGLITGVPTALTATLITMLAFGAFSAWWLRARARGARLPLAPFISIGFALGYGHHTGLFIGWY